jgi:hypothetical protein
MKSIVNGKLCDTDSAHCVGVFCDPCMAALYRKRNGEYFYVSTRTMEHEIKETGEETPLRELLEQAMDRDKEKCMFKALTVAEARELCETRLDIETYEDEFGSVDEEGRTSRKTIEVKLKRPAVDQLYRVAQEKGCYERDVMDTILEAWLHDNDDAIVKGKTFKLDLSTCMQTKDVDVIPEEVVTRVYGNVKTDLLCRLQRVNVTGDENNPLFGYYMRVTNLRQLALASAILTEKLLDIADVVTIDESV